MIKQQQQQRQPLQQETQQHIVTVLAPRIRAAPQSCAPKRRAAGAAQTPTSKTITVEASISPMDDWEGLWPVPGGGGPCHGVGGIVGTQHRSPSCSGQQGKKGRETRERAAGWPCCRYCMIGEWMQYNPVVKAWMAWDRGQAASSSAPSSTAPSSSAGAATQQHLQALQEQQTTP